MSTTKRLTLALLVVVMVGTAACSDATGPRADTAPCENQGSGGRCH